MRGHGLGMHDAARGKRNNARNNAKPQENNVKITAEITSIPDKVPHNKGPYADSGPCELAFRHPLPIVGMYVRHLPDAEERSCFITYVWRKSSEAAAMERRELVETALLRDR